MWRRTRSDDGSRSRRGRMVPVAEAAKEEVGRMKNKLSNVVARWILAAFLLPTVSGCGEYHFHYHAPAQHEPEMTLELPAEEPDHAQVD